MFQRLLSLALVAAAGLTAGCGSGPREIAYPQSGASLTGTVSYGKDRVGAALVIVQNDKGSATAFVDDEGRFEIGNVPVGEVGIGVNTAAGRGQAMGRMMAQTQGKAKGPPRVIMVPDKFADPIKSGIKTTISKGENNFDVVIPK